MLASGKIFKLLPTRGEFFTEKGIAKAVLYARVLLSLTEDDLKGRDLYPFFALSARLRHCGRDKFLLSSRGFHWINETPYNTYGPRTEPPPRIPPPPKRP